MKRAHQVHGHHVRKAVIPAAGLGTRLGALSAILPKELIPLVNKPSLHWILDEAAEAGISEVCLVISPAKSELMYKFLSTYTTTLKIDIIMQRYARGLGHAVLAAERWVGGEPFAVILPDDYLLGENATEQLMDIHHKTGMSVFAVSETPEEELSQYGVAQIKVMPDGLLHVLDIVEKPRPGTAPSNLSVVGRYVLAPTIWEYLHHEAMTSTGEIQLTSALQSLAHEARVTAFKSRGERHDLGNPRGWLKANIAFDNWISRAMIPRKPLRNGLVAERPHLLRPSHPEVPRITKKMLTNAVIQSVDLSKVEVAPHAKRIPSLLSQMESYQSSPTSSSPFLILFEEKAKMYLVSGQERLDEFKAVGMKKAPAWIIKREKLA